MTHQTKKRTGEVRLMKNGKSISNEIVARKDRLKQSLRHFYDAGAIPALWVTQIARIEGLGGNHE